MSVEESLSTHEQAPITACIGPLCEMKHSESKQVHI